MELRKSLLSTDDKIVDHITTVPIHKDMGQDFLIWSPNQNGLFTMSSIKKMLQPTTNGYGYQWIWKLKTLNKIKFFYGSALIIGFLPISFSILFISLSIAYAKYAN